MNLYHIKYFNIDGYYEQDFSFVMRGTEEDAEAVVSTLNQIAFDEWSENITRRLDEHRRTMQAAQQMIALLDRARPYERDLVEESKFGREHWNKIIFDSTVAIEEIRLESFKGWSYKWERISAVVIDGREAAINHARQHFVGE